MLRLHCPHCGCRCETEFSFGGPAGIHRPGPPEAVSDARWADYLYFRDNPRGPHAESWRHTYGCGEWVDVVRDTLTHDWLAPASTQGGGS